MSIRRLHRRLYGSFLVVMALALTGVAAGCPGPMPAKDYVDADRANYNDLAPKYSNYFEHDPALSEDAKQAERDSLLLWNARISAATGSTPTPIDPSLHPDPFAREASPTAGEASPTAGEAPPGTQ